MDKLCDFLSMTQPSVNVLMEAIISPEKIRVNGLSIAELNTKFESIGIEFKSARELKGYYDPSSEKIIIQVPDNYGDSELEAMIGHELIHREQNKRSNNLYSHQTKKLVQEINELIAVYEKSPNSKTQKEIENKINFFLYNTSQEKMAYAFQLVMDTTFGFKSPSDIIKHLEKIPTLKIDNQLKKYIGMYWLIKDKL